MQHGALVVGDVWRVAGVVHGVDELAHDIVGVLVPFKKHQEQPILRHSAPPSVAMADIDWLGVFEPPAPAKLEGVRLRLPAKRRAAVPALAASTGLCRVGFQRGAQSSQEEMCGEPSKPEE